MGLVHECKLAGRLFLSLLVCPLVFTLFCSFLHSFLSIFLSSQSLLLFFLFVRPSIHSRFLPSSVGPQWSLWGFLFRFSLWSWFFVFHLWLFCSSHHDPSSLPSSFSSCSSSYFLAWSKWSYFCSWFHDFSRHRAVRLLWLSVHLPLLPALQSCLPVSKTSDLHVAFFFSLPFPLPSIFPIRTVMMIFFLSLCLFVYVCLVFF